jgi:hypothetical protein
MPVDTARPWPLNFHAPAAQHQRARHVPGALRLALRQMGVARPAQRGALRFHFFLDERQSGDHHGVPQCCACQPAQRQHQLLLRALLSTSALAG